jgi:hypothetical protein
MNQLRLRRFKVNGINVRSIATANRMRNEHSVTILRIFTIRSASVLSAIITTNITSIGKKVIPLRVGRVDQVAMPKAEQKILKQYGKNYSFARPK